VTNFLGFGVRGSCVAVAVWCDDWMTGGRVLEGGRRVASVQSLLVSSMELGTSQLHVV